MKWRDQVITPAEDAALTVSLAFLANRLLETDTVAWAMGLGQADKAKKLAVLRILAYPPKPIGEPWLSAWRLIEQQWDQSNQPTPGEAHALKRRITTGETSGALIAEVTDLLTPRIKLGPGGALAEKRRRAPKNIADLVAVQFDGERLVKPNDLGIAQISDLRFLMQLIDSLSQKLNGILSLASRLEWDTGAGLWQLGSLNRVYATAGNDDADEYGRGIASLVKTLDALLHRLSNLSPRQAQSIAALWEVADDSIHLRLWASAARSRSILSGDIVGARLRQLPPKAFWDLHHFPEIAEARAVRFGDFTQRDQRAIAQRLMRLPPAAMWRNHSRSAEELKHAREYWAVRELRRIQVAGFDLPARAASWLQQQANNFPELMGPIDQDEGFLTGPKAHFVSRKPDAQFDDLVGTERLESLEQQLKRARLHWDEDPAESAAAWITDGSNASQLLEDFEAAASNGLSYPNVWDRFGWSHLSVPDATQIKHGEILRVLRLLPQLNDKTRAVAIDGLTYWLSRAADADPEAPGLVRAWFAYWPDAVEATNRSKPSDRIDVEFEGLKAAPQEVPDIDTLNNPAGRMVGVFFSYLQAQKPPIFRLKSTARRMRSAIIAATGHAAIVATRRFVEAIQYFRYHDKKWTDAVLLPPLREESSHAVMLWRGLARRALHRDTLSVLSDEVINRISDSRLDRNSRSNLLFSVIVETLHSLRVKKKSSIAAAKIQQLLRNVDDETRASGASAVRRFVSDLAKPARGKRGATRESLFRRSAKPFLMNIWPQERSLTTPGVAKSFSDLPATSGEAFSEAVGVIERFLVPFDCWSLLDYGLYGDGEDGPRLNMINTPEKARALLQLLHQTVGTADGAVVPHDIGAALNRIREIDEGLSAAPTFRRLAAVARL